MKNSVSQSWTFSLSQLAMEYFSALWSYRNGVLYGHTAEDVNTRELTSMAEEITAAYNTYASDPFAIPMHLSSLFSSKMLEQFLKQDRDTMTCLLCFFRESLETQKEQICCYAESAKDFFKPCSASSLCIAIPAAAIIPTNRQHDQK
jgi:hypothetical protein